jgi:hypothetical protein
MQGRNKEYATQLLHWIRDERFSEIILLNSADKLILLQECENLGKG